MDFSAIGGPLISAGASIIGAKMSADSSAKAARLNAIAQATENNINREYNERLQKEFAQQGIRWRVEDARAAGIHPLAALGAQTQSFSNHVGGSIAPFSGDSIGSGIASAGQDLSRAFDAMRTKGEKTDAYTKSVQELSLQKMGLENQLLASQIAKINQAGQPPGMPGGAGPSGASIKALGSGSGLVKDKALERTIAEPSKPSQEPGTITETGHSKTLKGWAPMMSKDVQERLEEDMMGTLAWNLRNRLLPTVGVWNNKQPPFPAPNGKEWFYHPLYQEFRLRKAPVQGPLAPSRKYERVRGYSNYLRMN